MPPNKFDFFFKNYFKKEIQNTKNWFKNVYLQQTNSNKNKILWTYRKEIEKYLPLWKRNVELQKLLLEEYLRKIKTQIQHVKGKRKIYFSSKNISEVLRIKQKQAGRIMESPTFFWQNKYNRLYLKYNFIIKNILCMNGILKVSKLPKQAGYSYINTFIYKLLYQVRNNFSQFKIKKIWMNSNCPATYTLIAINTVIFLLWQMARPKYFDWKTNEFRKIGIVSTEFMWHNFSTCWHSLHQGAIHTLITSNFSHSDAKHFLFNIIAMYFIGRSLEMSIGCKNIILAYLQCGCFAMFFQAFVQKTRRMFETPILGASSAVNGLMTMAALIDPWATVYLYGILPMPMIGLVGMLLLYDTFSNNKNDHIGHEGHIAGIVAGGIIYFFKYKR